MKTRDFETEAFMAMIQEGIFLLYRRGDSFAIGQLYSDALEDMLGETELAGKDILPILAEKLSGDEFASIQRYLVLLFDADKNEKMLQGLNPLRDLNIVREREASRYLDFSFCRAYGNETVDHLLVTVQDVTREVTLNEEFKKEKEKSDRKMKQIFSILQIQPRLLSSFLEEIERELTAIAFSLHTASNPNEFHSILVIIARIMHSIKGNSSLLNLDYFVQEAHEFENEIENLRSMAAISEKDMLPLSDRLSALMVLLDDVKGYIRKIVEFKETYGAQDANMAEMILLSVQRAVESLSVELGKRVVFNSSNFDPDAMKFEYRKLIKDVLIQLIKNSLYHGVEDEAARVSKGKAIPALIKLSSREDESGIHFTLEDDGRGLDLQSLSARALDVGLYAEEEIARLTDNELAAVIFAPGVSTAEKVDEHAGRGVGMDMVRDRIESNGGSIEVESARDQFCRFHISLPAA